MINLKYDDLVDPFPEGGYSGVHPGLVGQGTADAPADHPR